MILPAGIENGLEIYRNENGVSVLLNGNRNTYMELPDQLREPFQVALIKDPKALEALVEMGILDGDDQEEMFVGCRFGALNYRPDLDGSVLHSDAPFCDKIKTCSGFAKVCQIPAGLSRMEFVVSVEIGRGLLNKEIAAKHEIKENTVETHKRRALKKLCFNNRIELARWAQNEGIV